jgi:hypothetical protein
MILTIDFFYLINWLLNNNSSQFNMEHHICKRCGYSATTKASLIRHLLSKIPCEAKNDNTARNILIEQLQHREYKTDTINCPCCNKLLSKSHLSRHKKTCKQRQKQTEEPTEHVDSLTVSNEALPQITELRKQLFEMHEKHSSEIQTLKECIVSLQAHQPSNDTVSETQNSATSKQQRKKAKITQAMRIVCWNTYIGEEIGKTQCVCCKTNFITQHNFQCGHVVAEANGGTVQVDNLRPICAVCNNSMGTMDMKEFAFDNFNVEI